jgi:hypothetical protein
MIIFRVDPFAKRIPPCTSDLVTPPGQKLPTRTVQPDGNKQPPIGNEDHFLSLSVFIT